MSDPLRPSSGQALSRHTVTFIVRLWAEYLEQTPPSWRGEILQTDTNEQFQFTRLEELPRFMQSCVELANLSSTKEPEI